MENRAWRVLLIIAWLLFLIFSPVGVVAENDSDSLRMEPVIQPEVARRELEPIEIDEENFELGLFAGILSIEDFGSNPIYGARLAYHVTELLFMELGIGASEAGETSYETLSGNIRLLPDDDRRYTYYNISLGFNLLPGEVFFGANHAINSQFYLIGGIGNTHFTGNDKFTVNLGAGLRLLLTDWLALRLDARDHLFNSDLLGEEKTTHNLELHAGLSLFF